MNFDAMPAPRESNVRRAAVRRVDKEADEEE
jgi:hypothetical protein